MTKTSKAALHLAEGTNHYWTYDTDGKQAFLVILCDKDVHHVLSHIDFLQQTYVSVLKYVGADGETAETDAATAHKLTAFQKHFNPTTQKRQDELVARLPVAERERLDTLLVQAEVMEKLNEAADRLWMSQNGVAPEDDAEERVMVRTARQVEEGRDFGMD